MKKLISILFCVLTCQASAAPGDELVVLNKIVNMRSGPSVEEPILLKLEQGRKLSEIRREGRWVEVATAREDIPSGWVYYTLVGQAPEVAKESEEKFESVYDLFVLALAELNKDLQGRLGFVPFVESKDLDKGHIELTAADAWLALPRVSREAQLSEVFAIWAAAVGVGRSITIFVVDKDGEQSMSMLR